MKRFFTLMLAVSAAAVLQAGELTPLDLSTLKLAPGVTVEKEGEQTFLRIDHTKGTAAESKLVFNLEEPKSTQESYALTGEVRYRGMAPGSYLETWNHFGAKPGDKVISISAFSRTLGESGPMGKLSGESEWRAFILPFFMNDGSKRHPLRVTFNVQFQGAGGVVEIRNLHWSDGFGESAAVPGTGNAQAMTIAGFAGGVAVAALSAVAVWKFLRHRTARELRRIQAADA